MAIPNARLAKPVPKKKIVVDDLDELAAMRAEGPKVPEAFKPKTPAPMSNAVPGVGDNAGVGLQPTKPAEGGKPTKSPVGIGGNRGLRDRAPVEADDDLDEVVDARMAAEQEIDAQNAQATQQQRARAGLMGGGLSGASSAAEGDLARQQARAKTLAMQDFDRQAENDDFTDIQRRAAIMDLEDAYDTDIDGDGMINSRRVEGAIGDGNPENDPAEAPAGTDAERQALSEFTDILDVNDYNQSPFGDADTQPGSFEEPFAYQGTKTGLEAAIGESAPGALPLRKLQGKDGMGGPVTIYVDQYGNHYTLAESSGAPSRREQGAR